MLENISVVKIGTSSLTNEDGSPNIVSINNISNQVNNLISKGHQIVIVASGAVSVGLKQLNYNVESINKNTLEYKKMLPAVAGVGQPILFSEFQSAFTKHNITCAQVLLTAHSLYHREEYLHVRSALEEMITHNIVPIINENDCVSSSSLRYGDNDLIAALTAHMLSAKKLLLLTDVSGVYDSNPLNIDANLIHEIDFVTESVLALVNKKSSSNKGSGGMGSKLTAAKIASWSNIETIIASANEKLVIQKAVTGQKVGTKILPKKEILSRKKLWIGFVQPTMGKLFVDEGAAKALLKGKSSLLFAGVKKVLGEINSGDGVEIVDSVGNIIAKGISNADISEKDNLWKDKKIAVKKDYLVILPTNK